MKLDEADHLAWRQWHHWNRLERMALMDLNEGVHVRTLHTVAEGGMNTHTSTSIL